MATTPEYIVYDGQPGSPEGVTPFAFFDSESQFVNDGPKVANFVATRLGYPIMDVELQDKQIYACFEEAIIEYGKQVNQFRLRDNMYNLLGKSTSESITGRNIQSTSLPQVVRLSRAYGTEALVGGNVELKRGVVHVSENTQSYDLKALWADVSESGNAIEIRQIYHFLKPAISRYYDPFATTGLGLTNLMSEFGFDGFSPAVTFIMMPAYEDMLRIQAIEINDQVRKSLYSFTISNNIVEFTPLFAGDDNIYFDYYVVDDKDEAVLQSGSAAEFISDFSNAPLDHIPYTNINSIGRTWIFNYTLAVSKELLGIIRSKYERIPIPNDDIRLDGELLRKEAAEEKRALIEDLQETLKTTGLQEQMKIQEEVANAQNVILDKVPIPIYIM